MLKEIKQSVLLTLILAVILCGVYPLVVTLIGQVLFNDQANGSLLKQGDQIVGSRLIGQSFSKPEYFHGRPSAAGSGYDASASSGTNLGPTSSDLKKKLDDNVTQVLKDNPSLKAGEIPVDLVTASGSGLDPDISPEGALVQIDRVAKARNLSPIILRGLVETHTQGPQLGLLGEPSVNVLQLNLALDDIGKSQ